MALNKKRITVAYGDGIGPEIMGACLDIIQKAGAQIETDVIELGEKLYREGHSSGIRNEDWETIAKNRVLLKAPITTPQGGGYKSLNVTIRKTLGLYANVRPVRSYFPMVATKHPHMDMVIIRENEEDLYAGIEHRQTPEVYQCLKLITRPGCERIVRYAFEYARAHNRQKVTCMTKDNIMKLTDGLFHKVFKEVASEYPEIKTDHQIIDIGTARLAETPEHFDVVVVPNLYGDIISDVAAQIAGSVGLAGSCNIGEHCAMFEAIHGSAPDIANQNKANPSGLLMASVMMLNHIGQSEVASRVENAWLKTIEDGLATADFYSDDNSKQLVSTHEFARAVIDRLGDRPSKLRARSTAKTQKPKTVSESPRKRPHRLLDGVDVFLYEEQRNPEWIAKKLADATTASDLELQMITNRGVKVYPNGNPHTFCTDHWRCRFVAKEEQEINHPALWDLLTEITGQKMEVIKTELLYSFDNQKAYSLGQGQ